MAFQQYTRCISAPDFHSRVRYITIASLLAGAPAAMVAVAMGHPICLWIALEIMALAALVAYYHNWLYHRLICLGGDRSCVAAIVSISEPHLTVNLLDRDTDYSLNLLLKNTEYGGTEDTPAIRQALQAAAQASTPFGELIAPQPSVTAIGRETPGIFGKDRQTGNLAAVLHAEFEGDGMYKMLLASKVLLATAIFAMAACLLGGPFLGLVILILSLIVLLFTSLLGIGGGGSPSNNNTGDVTDNTGTNADGQGVGADILFIEGTWVYDTLHEGWNEIHPIKVCTKMGTWEGEWPDDIIILRLNQAFQVARAEETIANQALPENQWQIHPDLDGCAREIIL